MSKASYSPLVRVHPVQITLVRHGPPVRCHAGWLTRAEFGAWRRAYEVAGLQGGSEPSRAAILRMHTAATVVSSDLRRARESAERLRAAATLPDSVQGPALAWALLREVDLPALTLAPAVRLPLLAWLVGGFAGWRRARLAGTESLAEARARAERAALALEDAAVDGPVVAVGHAVFHGLVAAALRERGWRGPRWWAGRYWATTTLSRDV